MNFKIYQYKINITHVSVSKTRQLAFGVTLEPEPRNIFIPHWIVKAYRLKEEDMGETFEVLFIDNPKEKNPCVIAMLDEDCEINNTSEVGTFCGRPGTEGFTAFLNELNGKTAQ